MNLSILSNVPEENRFWLADGRQISSVKELFYILNSLPQEIFSQHVNETKNDFYNWVKDVYANKNLADDLLECTTREAMLFCLRSSIDQAESLLVFNEIPKENVLESVKFENLKKPLVTILNTSILKKTVKSNNKINKVVNNSNITPIVANEKFNKAQIKRIKSESAKEIIKKLKGVYDIE